MILGDKPLIFEVVLSQYNYKNIPTLCNKHPRAEKNYNRGHFSTPAAQHQKQGLPSHRTTGDEPNSPPTLPPVIENSTGTKNLEASEFVTFYKIQKNSVKFRKIRPKCI
jgi:hypothetical protein